MPHTIFTNTDTKAEAMAALNANFARTLPRFNVFDYGAVADGQVLYDVVFTSGDATFTSATASFTAADVGKTIVLQLSQTSRQITTIASINGSTSVEMADTADANSSDYEDFAATYIGTDNTEAIQDAIDACWAAGGGAVVFAEGIYLCSGAPANVDEDNNSVFYIPHGAASTDVQPAISLTGSGIPGFAHFNPGQKPGLSGTILYFPNQTVSGTDPAIFATVASDFSGHYWNSVPTTFRIENITVRQPANPQMHGVQWHRGGSLFLDSVIFDLDVPYSISTNLLADPNSGAATAIICPGQPSGYFSNISRAYVYGYYTGLRIGDTTLVSQFVAELCRVGLQGGTTTNGMQATHVGIYRCKVAIQGTMKINIGLANIESYRGGGIDFAPSWCQNSGGNYEIDNYDGAIRGHINVHTTLAGTGAIPTTVRQPSNGIATDLEVFDLHTGKNLGVVLGNSITLASEITAPTPLLTVGGTTGSTSYSYRIGYLTTGGAVQLGPIVTATTGNATLTGTNKITITAANVDGASTVYIYRVASAGTPSTVGKIGTQYPGTSGVSFEDTGLAGDDVLPTDTSGTLTARRVEISGTLNGRYVNLRDVLTTQETRSSGDTGTTLTDTSLSLTLPAGIWKVYFDATFRNAGTEPGIKLGYSYTGATFVAAQHVFQKSGATDILQYRIKDIDDSLSSLEVDTDDATGVRAWMLLTVSSSATVKVQLAQKNSHANATRMRAASLEAVDFTPQ